MDIDGDENVQALDSDDDGDDIDSDAAGEAAMDAADHDHDSPAPLPDADNTTIADLSGSPSLSTLALAQRPPTPQFVAETDLQIRRVIEMCGTRFHDKMICGHIVKATNEMSDLDWHLAVNACDLTVFMSFIYSIVVTLSTNHIFQYCVCIYVC
jgi:hypothetical protein